MAKLIDYGDGRYTFYCPGCGHHHIYYTRNENPLPNWTFNGNMESPTFSPSLLNRWGKYVPGYENKIKGGGICHLNVTNGKIDYYDDCTHEYKGRKQVEMEGI